MSEKPDAQASVADRMAAARAARAANAEASAPVAPAADAPATAATTSELLPGGAEPEHIPAGPSFLERAAANEEEKRQAKIAALRAAKVARAAPAVDPHVTVRILKKGHGLVSMGEHIEGLGDLTYDFGETPKLPKSVALALEERGLVEIQ